MRILLAFRTALGSRVVVAEGGDPETARAIAEAHRSLGLDAHTLEDQGRFDMKAYLKRVKIRAVKAARNDPKIVEIRRPK